MKIKSKKAEIEQLLRQRILILDGAMGTMIQRQRLSEADFRSGRFASHSRDLRGNNDLLSLTQAGLIESIHGQYLEAGADIVETNTFSSNAISLADYGLESIVFELNSTAAALARTAVEKQMRLDPSRPRFVAGAMGPTNKTASLSPQVSSRRTGPPWGEYLTAFEIKLLRICRSSFSSMCA